MKQHDISKLPKWAQDRIRLLERNLEDATTKLLTGPEDSNTFADPFYFGLDSDGRPLGKGTRVRFTLGPHFTEYIDVRVENNQLDLSSGRSLFVAPRASNHAYVVLED